MPNLQGTQDDLFFPLSSNTTVQCNQGESLPKNNEINQESCTIRYQDDLRQRLKYYFMNPLEKWHLKKRIPFKLFLQIFKIICFTIQIIMIGPDTSDFFDYQKNTENTFRELLFPKWNPLWEVSLSPPVIGPYAIYTKEDLFYHIDYSIISFSNLTQISVGNFGYLEEDKVSNISLHIFEFVHANFKPISYSFNYTKSIVTNTINISTNYPPGDEKWSHFSIKDYFSSIGYNLNFDKLVKIVMETSIKNIYLSSFEKNGFIDCFLIKILIYFDNSNHDGQIIINLKSFYERNKCNGNVEFHSNFFYRISASIMVLILSITSLILCLRSYIKAFYLWKETSTYFRRVLKIDLNFVDLIEFLDLWILLIIFTDILMIIGCGCQINDELNRIYFRDSLNSLLIGTSILLQYLGILRYLSFFSNYNILILTLKRSVPSLLRYFLCAIILYLGFCFCGWLVLGPYHYKFTSLSVTSECLFSMLNGDDLFVTFSTIQESNPLIWWFSRIYIYSFISLFIYVVLNLFISIIMDSWYVIKNFPSQSTSNLHTFINQGNEYSR